MMTMESTESREDGDDPESSRSPGADFDEDEGLVKVEIAESALSPAVLRAGEELVVVDVDASLALRDAEEATADLLHPIARQHRRRHARRQAEESHKRQGEQES